MSYYNEKVLNDLVEASRVDSLEAVFYTRNEVFNCFVSNPQDVGISHSIDINTIDLPGMNGQRHVFNNKKSTEISLGNIIFDTFALEKGLQSVIEIIEKLMTPDPKGEYEYVGFQWGSMNFYPCYLINFNYDIELLLAGNPGKIKASMQLVLTSNLSQAEIDKNLETVSGQLAEFEKGEVEEQAIDEIESNPSLVGGYQDYGRLITGDSELLVNDTGEISLVDKILDITRQLGIFNSVEQSISWFR